MERLTTNKNVLDMGMYELAHNCCYIAEDGAGRYRDYEMDMDQRELVRELMKQLAQEDMPSNPISFDETMMDYLALNPCQDVSGLIALLYHNMWAMADLREKLKRYEDAEERLADMFGGSLTLEMVVDELEQQSKEPDSPHPINARILTHKESADWDAYRAIGTPEECRAAMEKQTAKQIIDNTPTEDDMWYQCPACKGDLTKIRTFFCPYCGQRLSWNSKQYCCTCTWYDVDNGVCCNGENEHNRNLDDTCEKWEENEE